MGLVIGTVLDHLEVVLKNVLRFDTVSDEGVLLRKPQVIDAAAVMKNILKDETCIAGEGHRHIGMIDPFEIENDYVSHLVTELTVTEDGLDAVIRLLPTPRGDVVRHWIENGIYIPRMRTTFVVQGGEVMSLNFTTIDIIGG